MNRMGTAGGVVIAIFLLILGALLVSGILDLLLRVLGVVCILVALVIGGMAIFGRKNRF